MQVELRKSTEAELDRIKGDLLHDWAKSRPIDCLTEWSKSLYVGDELVAVGGAFMLWAPQSGVAEMWMLLGSKADKYKIEVVKRAREVIAMAFDELRLHRMQAVVRADFPEGLRFIEHLNFLPEGRLRCYTEDVCDALMFSIVKEGE
jgi:hypothetical protein